jgi:antitoxin component YwqK of YwqJK toxin-antitoxin module
MTVNYIKDVMNGKMKVWHSTGEKEYIINYRRGIRVGIMEGWFPSGKRKFWRNYDDYYSLLHKWNEEGKVLLDHLEDSVFEIKFN